VTTATLKEETAVPQKGVDTHNEKGKADEVRATLLQAEVDKEHSQEPLAVAHPPREQL